MTRTAPKSTSLESAEREAKKVGASVEEARLVHEVVTANTNPNVVRSFELKFGRDASDGEAVWVHLIVDGDLNPSTQKISKLNEVAKKVRGALLSENLKFWPYVDIRGRS